MPEVVAAATPRKTPKPMTRPRRRAALQRTEFAVDLGSANSLGGLRGCGAGS